MIESFLGANILQIIYSIFGLLLHFALIGTRAYSTRYWTKYRCEVVVNPLSLLQKLCVNSYCVLGLYSKKLTKIYSAMHLHCFHLSYGQCYFVTQVNKWQ